jgi:hypothetical protein
MGGESMNATTLAAFADHVERNLEQILAQDSTIRDIQRQWKHHPEATLPLLILGSEEDPVGLWTVVQALDQRFTHQPFSEDNPEDIHILESALDAVSACILEMVQPRISRRFSSSLLCRGLLEGYWCIYLLLPRSTGIPSLKPVQQTLFS